MEELEFTEDQQLFHQLVGTYLAVKSYADYCGGLISLFNKAANSNIRGQKGMKTFLAITAENEAKAKKHIKAIENVLKANYGITNQIEQFVANIEVNMNELLTLSPAGQNRVQNLINKIRQDKSESNFWNEFKTDHETKTSDK